MTDLSPEARAEITFSDLGYEARNRFFSEVVVRFARSAGDITANFRYRDEMFDHCPAWLGNGNSPTFANNSTLMYFQIHLPRNVSNPIFQEGMEIAGILTGDGFDLSFAGETSHCYSHDNRLTSFDNLADQINDIQTRRPTGDTVMYTISVRLHRISVNGMDFSYE